jgi:DNA-binding transcriptional LysR family regulator
MEWSSSQLRALVQLRRQGTMRGAARALGYTPGAISQQLATLERALGTPLLQRTGRRVRFTDAGTALAGHAQRILDIENEAVSDLEHDTQEARGDLHVGVFATAAVDILPGVLARARHRHAGLAVHTREVEVDDIHRSVASGAVDLAVGLDYPDNPIPLDPTLRTIRLRREPFELAAPPRALTTQGEIQLAEAADLDWILPPAGSVYGLAVRNVCRRHGAEPRVRHEVTDTAVSLALVEAGIGITPVTESMLRLRPSQVDRIPLREAFARDVVAVVRSVAAARPAIAALLDLLSESI